MRPCGHNTRTPIDRPYASKHNITGGWFRMEKYHKSSSSIDVINKEMLTDFLTIVPSSKQNKLPINYDKTTYMILGARGRIQDAYEPALNVDNKEIEKVSKQKILGICIDEHLTWTPHIDYLCSVISTKILLLKQISSYVPQDIQRVFCQSYILPLLDFGCNTWGATPGSNIGRLFKLQKRVVRIILHADYLTPSSLMFEDLGWLSIPKQLMYNKAILTYKALNNLTLGYISNLLKPISETHTLSLRSSKNGLLSIPRSRTALYIARFRILLQNCGIHCLSH